MQDVAHVAEVARIGPNSIIQTIAALREQYGAETTAAWLRRSGRGHFLETMPDHMLAESEFGAMIRDLRDWLGMPAAMRVLDRSGELTANYVATNRVPAPIRLLLPRLPVGLALRIFLPAIAKHAWTFAGSGQFGYTLRPQWQLTLANSVEAREVQATEPVCSYYRAAFEGLLRRVVSDRIRVREVACRAMGAPRCTFAVSREG
ncbi:bacteriochlorophyll 4-vinyl reductase [Chloroflexus sp.]|uniref:bacteriochlorophyll 4-vinyl reductase n=1 Tax=Chloroflexus sp. TaxID=1904827 RepID=UPI002ACEB933|nr:bacteriochlorophyll 4-vinyl reductase [Chloroflexus sp.]